MGRLSTKASTLHERAQGAFVWLSPTAMEFEAPTHSPLVWPTMVHPHSVPLDRGERFSTLVVVPFVDTNVRDEWERILKGYKDAMTSTRIDVQVKAQNTWRMLEEVARARGMGDLMPRGALDNPVTV